MITGGQLDTRVVIEYKEVHSDPTFGTEVVTWQPLVAYPGSPRVAAPVWAEWRDVLPSRAESVSQGAAVARSQSRLRLRYRTDITSAMRVTDVASGVVYQIISEPAMIGRRQWTEIMVERYSG